LAASASAQFVFFGNQFGRQQAGQQRFPAQPVVQQQRFGPRPSPALREGRFSSTFFRPSAINSINAVKKTSEAKAAAEPASVMPVADSSAIAAAAAAVSPPSTASPTITTTPAPRRPKGNYQWEGKNFLLTWRNGRSNFAWNEGVSYCKSQGMKLISLDSPAKVENFLQLVGRERAPYFWAGGEVSSDSRQLSWQNGKTEAVRKGQHPWSFTGRTGPQPDGGERCLAVLNNVYRDGVKFHDVACHHRKPVICEE